MGPTEDNLGYLSIYVLVVIIYSGLRTEDLGTRVPEYHSAKHLTNCGTAISSIKKKKKKEMAPCEDRENWGVSGRVRTMHPTFTQGLTAIAGGRV